MGRARSRIFFGTWAFGPSRFEDEFSFDGSGSGGQREVYYVDDNHTITKIADKNTSMPSAGANFTDFGSTLFYKHFIYFRGYTATNNRVGIYRYNTQTTALTTIMNWTSAIPNGSGNFNNATEPFRPYPPNASLLYALAFCGYGANGQRGYYLADTLGNLSKVADLNDLIPGTAQVFTDIIYWMAMTNDSINTFVGEGGVYKGIYMRINSRWKTIVDKTTSIPNGTGTFTDFHGIAVQDTNVFFVGYGTAGQAGIYKLIGTTLSKVADVNTTVPSESFSFNNFDYSPLAENGKVIFNGYSAGGYGGIFTDRFGSISKIVATGDIINGDTVLGAGIYEHNLAMNGNMDFITQIDFTNGKVGLYSVDYTPPLVSGLDNENRTDGTTNCLTVLPNPVKTSRLAVVKVEGLCSKVNKLVITASNGSVKEIIEYSVRGSDENFQELEIDISRLHLSKGSYTIAVHCNNGELCFGNFTFVGD